jgi:DNA-binding FrmR family transcriptional regulator
MSDIKQHSSHKDILLRLKRAHGHLAKVINMIEEEEGCLKISQQLFAVEKAITQAKKNLIHDHLEHCFEDISKKSSKHDLTEFKEITKYL